MDDHPYQEDMDTEMDNDKNKDIDIRYKTRLQESDRDRQRETEGGKGKEEGLLEGAGHPGIFFIFIDAKGQGEGVFKN